MTKQKILIVDDEPLARGRLRRLADDLPGYQVCGEAGDGDAALAQVAELQPDILLLDIRMPGLDGMEVAAHLSKLNSPPAIIFCTAYDSYAIQAFDVQAIAYLLKPVRKQALEEALARAGRVNRVQLQAFSGEPVDNSAGRNTAGNEQLAVRTHRGTELIDIAGIRYCQADQKYVTIHHSRGEAVSDYTLKELENAYPRQLLRIHRNTLVGVRFIQALKRTSEGHNLVSLRDNLGELQVSRRHASNVRQWLQGQQPG
ncbi:MAG: response regulator transcription factor [Oceanospirillales bacterium]|jgi:two-component system response regulator AlgR|uniref:LytR/AlgR family response regulator transcription factor n=1 Tax=Marinobacter maritimus TaxID=277961 RepID=UPI000BD941FA|nr:LytTR family DNA-binding domain-containing protein [Marinobacter maritimus]MBL1273182.1 response regulator transcription factor [Oceanospirillales bacterium]